MTYTTKTFLITGASSDIGLACRDIIEKNGHRCIGLFNSKGFAPMPLTRDANDEIDLTSASSIKETVDRLALSETIDSFISLGSINRAGGFWDTDSTEIEEHLFANAIAPLLIARMLANSMAKRKWGRITLTSSIGRVFGGSKSSFPYSFGKAAGEFIPAELKDLGAHNVLTNVVRIGATNTKRFRSLGKDIDKRANLVPLKRLATASEVAEYLYWISSPANSYVHNQIVAISGGE